MSSPEAYWIWLSRALGAGARCDEIIACFESPRQMYELGVDEWRLSGTLSYSQIQRLKAGSLESAEEIVRQCKQNGWRILTPDSPNYPRLLRTLTNFPLTVYVNGDISCLENSVPVAVVGSRKASLYSIGVARQLCSSMAKAGAVVVSGGALGIDSAAHEGALRAGGKTVAVLGCGFNVPYLTQNAALRAEIAKSGALISEFPPDFGVTASSFPIRNRIISGLSVGTVVIEASDKSGSLITAKCAAEQGRDVFAVPGDMTSIDFTGVNKLIRDGAKPVFSVHDILGEYTALFPGKALELPPNDTLTFVEGYSRFSDPVHTGSEHSTPEEVPKAAANTERRESVPVQKRKLPPDMSENAVKVYEVLGNFPLHIDEIVNLSKINTNMIFSALTELEICGFIKLTEGKHYIIV